MWRVLFALNVVLLALLAVSVPFQRPGTGAWVISIVSVAIIGASLLGLFVLIRIDWDPFSV
ncbi:hypothetical protein [Halegenticoccus tardaugens]|uniref:hypothetical protein n=1 Tax=Halegenticoccus tardaugens TaxID=2071624 RepID=UPI001E4661E1|nr:hypothetical protein [Halegenticoccus tardaugens]